MYSFICIICGVYDYSLCKFLLSLVYIKYSPCGNLTFVLRIEIVNMFVRVTPDIANLGQLQSDSCLSFVCSTRDVQKVLSLVIFRYTVGQKNVIGLSYGVFSVFSKTFMSCACIFYDVQFIELSW